MTTIQLSSPLPSPSRTPNCHIQGSSPEHPFASLGSPQRQVYPPNFMTSQPFMRDSSQLSSAPSVHYPLFNAPVPPGLETIKFPIDHRPPQRQSNGRPEDDWRSHGTLLQKRSISSQQANETPLGSTPSTYTRPLTKKKKRSDGTTATSATNLPILNPDHLKLEPQNIKVTEISAPMPDDLNYADIPNSALPSPMSDLGSMDGYWTHATWNDPPTTETTWDHRRGQDGDMVTNGFVSSLLETYDDLPACMQDYFLYQLLRHSPMSSLRVANDVITDALRTDFITCLPPQLSQQVLLYLDARSLCYASGVSRRWKRLIQENSDLWRFKIVEAGFTLTAAEIKRYGIAPEHLYRHRSPSSNHSEVLSSSSSSAWSPSPSYQSSTPSPLQTSCGLVTSPGRDQMEEGAAFNLLDIEYLDQPVMDASLVRASNDPTLYYRHALSEPSSSNKTMNDNPPTHPYLKIYKQHHIMRQNWKHNRAKRHQIRDHGDMVTCLQFDDDKIITGFDDTFIKVHDIRTGVLRHNLRGHEGGVWALHYVGNTLVTGSTDRTIRIFDIEKGVCRFVFRGHTNTVRCLQIVMPLLVTTTDNDDDRIQPSQPLIVSGARDKTLHVWKLPYLPSSSKPAQRQNSLGSAQQCVYTTDSRKGTKNEFTGIISADGIVDMDDPPRDSQQHDHNPFLIHKLLGHKGSIRALAAHANTLASGSYDHTVKLWDLGSGALKHTLDGHSSKVYSVAIDGQRQRCISGSLDSTVRIWNMLDGSCERILRGHSMLVGLLGVSMNHFISGGADGVLRVWASDALDDYKHLLVGHGRPITSFQHNEDRIISGAHGALKMWDTQTGKCLQDLITDAEVIWRVAFDERRCVAAVKDQNTTRLEILDYGSDTEQD